jgi:hypothetical protein
MSLKRRCKMDDGKEAREHQERAAASGTFTNEAQHFSRIREIFAKDGFIFVKVSDNRKEDSVDIIGTEGKVLKNQMMTIREAAARAKALNAMAHKFPPKDRAVAMEIVDNIVAACREARIQAEQIEDKKMQPAITVKKEQ